MLLKLDSDVSIDDVKNDLNEKINNGYCKNNYTFSINLIYKLIHEHSNYEDYQWQLYRFERKVVHVVRAKSGRRVRHHDRTRPSRQTVETNASFLAAE